VDGYECVELGRRKRPDIRGGGFRAASQRGDRAGRAHRDDQGATGLEKGPAVHCERVLNDLVHGDPPQAFIVSAARLTARMTAVCEPQRHFSGASSLMISSSVTDGFFSRR